MNSGKVILDQLFELDAPGVYHCCVKQEIKGFESSVLTSDNENKKAVWKFDKVRIVNIRPYMNVDGKKVHNKCYVTIDFGFFMEHDIGINNDEKFGLTWSQDFGWSRFKLCDSYIDNPYGDEVRNQE
ncbi:MAG: hypothetical protein KAS32_03780 [Candidatus Peribacteraceae bacterium]|nr:hypothetical protein [Candidatus Peribacteraceae bacterium]